MDHLWLSGFAIFIYFVIFIGIILAWAGILVKAGQNRWLCFLIIIPVVNLIFFFWFAYSKWPIHEFVSRDWRRKLLEEKKRKLEQELNSLSNTHSGKENISLKHHNKEEEIRLQYKQVKKLSEDNFLKAAKFPTNSPEKESYFRIGTEYKQKAEALEKQLDNIQEHKVS